ncbi:hypothetical protein Ddye_010838 [Dipteronia dyeriana]|uniref:Uncharacterized protein n=1 Tax=Dipteronia dyeriana TaxID=168575 RepID=A0AAD9XEM6_9ROSI|nr:hypothetical protein Ddye_010838 [Dipteronia dyeriana]
MPLLPLATRIVGSPRTFHSSISSVLDKRSTVSVREVSFHFNDSRIGLKPSKRRLIASMMKNVSQLDSVFEIQDNPGERKILFTREYRDEIIKVKDDMFSVDDEDEEDEEEEDEDDEDEDEEDDDD